MMTTCTALAQRYQPTPPADSWACWNYTPGEWEQLDRLDWGFAQRKMVLRWVFPTILLTLALGILTAALVGRLSLQDSLFAILLTLLVLLACSVIPIFLALPAYRAAKARHVARQAGPHTIIIGPVSKAPLLNQGLWQAGFYIPLQQFMVIDLQDARLSPDLPAVMQVQRRFRSGRTTAASGQTARTAGWSDTLFILVPFGHEAEAATLIERFKRETIEVAAHPLALFEQAQPR